MLDNQNIALGKIPDPRYGGAKIKPGLIQGRLKSNCYSASGILRQSTESVAHLKSSCLHRQLPASLFLISGLLLAQTAQAAIWISEDQKLEIFGDTRLRFERDFDSREESGEKRDDRDRLRFRAKIGARYTFDEHFRLQVRARTNPVGGQQTTNITIADFSGNDTDDFHMALDQWFIEARSQHARGWLGRSNFPFWQHNDAEVLWGDNVTIAGGYMQTELPHLRNTAVQLRAGHFALPDGHRNFTNQLTAAQFVFDQSLDADWVLRYSFGYFHINGSGEARYLSDGNANRDYKLGVVSIQADRPLPLGAYRIDFIRFGGDLIRNFESYSSRASDPVTAQYHDERDGFAISTTVGGKATKPDGGGAWHLNYLYAYIEKFAINSAYGQSNWVRWGEGKQSDVSNMKGHEIGLRYWFSKNVDINNRLFLVDSITTGQDGNRFRVDMNIRF